MSEALWTEPGETLSHNNACKEFGLKEHEIIEAIKAGKLQYRQNYAHGNPYFRLLRQEVVALTIELRGHSYFEKQKIEHEIKKVTKQINSCKRKIKACEKEKASLVEQLAQLEE
jgi:septal ring factor EnvC (AmiA/AmiB activator)